MFTHRDLLSNSMELGVIWACLREQKVGRRCQAVSGTGSQGPRIEEAWGAQGGVHDPRSSFRYPCSPLPYAPRTSARMLQQDYQQDCWYYQEVGDKIPVCTSFSVIHHGNLCIWVEGSVWVESFIFFIERLRCQPERGDEGHSAQRSTHYISSSCPFIYLSPLSCDFSLHSF